MGFFEIFWKTKAASAFTLEKIAKIFCRIVKTVQSKSLFIIVIFFFDENEIAIKQFCPLYADDPPIFLALISN